jgi:hypothetical protein
MRGAIVRRIELILLTSALLLVGYCCALGQERDSLENECDSLQNAIPPDLVQYLSGVIPDEKNGDCVTWAIKKLGKEQYEPAIPVLIKLLDFRRPPTAREKRGFLMHPPFVSDLYPAAGALDLIGKKALPQVLLVIEAEASSARARENAVSVWMEAYKYERPKGIALLKQEETKTNDDGVKQELKWAVQKALTHCGMPEEKEGASCRQAAATAVP